MLFIALRTNKKKLNLLSTSTQVPSKHKYEYKYLDLVLEYNLSTRSKYQALQLYEVVVHPHVDRYTLEAGALVSRLRSRTSETYRERETLNDIH